MLPASVQAFIDHEIAANTTELSDLRAVYLNGRLRSPEPSHTEGLANNWTTRDTVFGAWNMLHTARRLKHAGGIPAHGNVTSNLDLSDPEHPNPEYR
jgi:hypothetical protein